MGKPHVKIRAQSEYQETPNEGGQYVRVDGVLYRVGYEPEASPQTATADASASAPIESEQSQE